MAACMLEIAQDDREKAMLKQPVYREAAKAKARKLSALLSDEVVMVQTVMDVYPKLLAEKQDLFDHGLIDRHELDDFMAGAPQKHIEQIVNELRNYPDCYMLDQAPQSEALQKIKALAGQ